MASTGRFATLSATGRPSALSHVTPSTITRFADFSAIPKLSFVSLIASSESNNIPRPIRTRSGPNASYAVLDSTISSPSSGHGTLLLADHCSSHTTAEHVRTFHTATKETAARRLAGDMITTTTLRRLSTFHTPLRPVLLLADNCLRLSASLTQPRRPRFCVTLAM
ncbi:hypothetical protein RhiJN_18262 [Ceratobasidium sp. AG-Ba]|nr:hypothetical protein RhiJN_18262 [Ceratobasidium sp. AG-Ba]